MPGKLPTHARHSSESVEHYSPEKLVEAARFVLGAFDLDPASCLFANQLIQAKTIYTEQDNGFRQPWSGRVFLNPPGGRSDDQERPVKPKCTETGSCGLPIGHRHTGAQSSQKKWWFRLAQQYVDGSVQSAIFVGFSVEILQVTQSGGGGLPTPMDFPLCFPTSRVAYDRNVGGVRKAGGSPPHSSVIVLLPGSPAESHRFGSQEGFGGLGRCINLDAPYSVRRIK